MKKTPSWFQYPKYNWKTKHAIVIGGGIAGAQMAWHLCQKNWQVTLIERHPQLACEASGNPIGVISPKMTAAPSIGEDFYTQSFHYTLSLLKALDKQNKKIEWDACGALQLAHNARELKRWQALKERKLPSDFVQLLDQDKTEEIAGVKLHDTHSYKSTYFPKGAWVKPDSFVSALSRHTNCEIILETEAIRLEKKGKYWLVINQSNRCIARSEVLIISNGKDLFSFEQTAFLPYMPVAGQTTMSTASDFSSQLATVIGHEGYLTPAVNGQHIFGATFDRDNPNPRLNEKANFENYEQLKHYLPEFAEALSTINSAHAAVRITTPDRFPYVGALPDQTFYQQAYNDLHQGKQWKQYPKAKYQDGLFILGGLGSRGLTTSAYCANSLVDLLNNKQKSKQATLLLQHCHPARFLIKNLKRNKNPRS